MTLKFLLYFMAFIGEWAFGKKPKNIQRRADDVADDDSVNDPARHRRSAATRWFRALANKIQRSRKFAASVIVLLCLSIFANYHLLGKISTVVREGSENRPTRRITGTVSKTAESNQAYYEHLVDHLKNTYSE